MAKKKSVDYWRDRFALLEDKLYSEYAYKNAEEIKEVFSNSLANINKDIAIWLQRFADNNDITLAEAERLISSKELKELGWNVDEYVKKGIDNSYTRLWDKELENASAKFHISRLEALKIQIIDKCENMFSDLDNIINEAMKKTYTEGYYGTVYEISKGLNVGVNVAKINENLLNKIIHKPWSDDGVEFSSRIWGKYRPLLVNRLHKDLTDCIIRGINPQSLATSYAKEFKVSENAAINLLMTEYSQFASLSNTDCLNDLGTEEYEIIETLDGNTCEKCQDVDKKHFPMKELEVGINAPPFHNRCRGTKCPYFDDEFTTNLKRAARDPETGKTVYVDDMSYKEWKEKFVVDNNYFKANQTTVISDKKDKNDFSVARKLVNSKEFHDKFNTVTIHKAVNEAIYQKTMDMLEHRDGTEYEDLFALDARTGKVISMNDKSGKVGSTGFTKEQYDKVISNKNNVILVHNHPNSSRPSFADIKTLFNESSVECSVIACHDGTLYIISKPNRKIDIDKIYADLYNKYIDVFGNRDIAKIKATNDLYEMKGLFYYEKR